MAWDLLSHLVWIGALAFVCLSPWLGWRMSDARPGLWRGFAVTLPRCTGGRWLWILIYALWAACTAVLRLCRCRVYSAAPRDPAASVPALVSISALPYRAYPLSCCLLQ